MKQLWQNAGNVVFYREFYVFVLQWQMMDEGMTKIPQMKNGNYGLLPTSQKIETIISIFSY